VGVQVVPQSVEAYIWARGQFTGWRPQPRAVPSAEETGESQLPVGPAVKVQVMPEFMEANIPPFRAKANRLLPSAQERTKKQELVEGRPQPASDTQMRPSVNQPKFRIVDICLGCDQVGSIRRGGTWLSNR
jgi:hypothetical protein